MVHQSHAFFWGKLEAHEAKSLKTEFGLEKSTARYFAAVTKTAAIISSRWQLFVSATYHMVDVSLTFCIAVDLRKFSVLVYLVHFPSKEYLILVENKA